MVCVCVKKNPKNKNLKKNKCIYNIIIWDSNTTIYTNIHTNLYRITAYMYYIRTNYSYNY